MASLEFKTIGSGKLGLKGTKEGKVRKVVNGDDMLRVYSFTVHPVQEEGLLSAAEASVEITRVRSVLKYQTDKRQIMVTIENTGEGTCGYVLVAAIVKLP